MKARRTPRRRTTITVGGGGGTPSEPDCGASTYTFGTGVTQIDGWPGSGDYTQNYEPGSILEITNGNRASLRINNVQGTEECPITIRNSSGGAVVFTSTSVRGLYIRNCRHVIIDGAGASGVEYGFQATAAISAGATQSVFVGFRSIHVRMNNIEVANNVNSVGLMIHTKSDGSYDYEESSPGTPSTFSGDDAWLDEDITLYHIYSHDNKESGFYLGNNHAQRDDVPDLANLTIYDSISDDCGGGFNFKTQTNLRAFDLEADSNEHPNSSFSYNYNLDPGCSGVLHDSIGTNVSPGPARLGINLRNSFRPMEVYNMTISDSDVRSIQVAFPAAEEDDGGTVNIHDNNLTSPGGDGIRFDVQNVAAAAGSRIVDNIIEFNAADDCIDVRDQAVGTESGNTCTPI